MNISFSKKNRRILAFSAMLFFSIVVVLAFAPKAEAADPIYKVLSPVDNCTAGSNALQPAADCFDGMGKVVVQIWYTVMTAVNSLVLAMLIWVAFMNILRQQMDSYAVKKILPAFIMAVVLSNFSFLIARIMIDIGNVSISIFLDGSQTNGITGAFDGITTVLPSGPSDGTITNYSGYIFIYMFKQLFVLVASVLILILSFLFMIRNYFLYFLIAIAPAAYMAMILPMTKKYFQQWWSQFMKWVFMPVISVFWLWLAGQFLTAISSNEIWILPMGFAGLCLYMAITSPFKVDKAVGAWGGFGKKAWNKTGGAAWNATGGAGVKAAKDYVGFQYGVGKNWAREKARNLPGIRNIDRAIGKGAITKDLYERKVKKQADIRKKINTMNFLNDKGPEWLENVRKSDPVTAGRLKAMLGDLGAEETGPNYKDQFKLKHLAERQLYYRNQDGTRERADVYRIANDAEYRKRVEDYFKKSKANDLVDPEKRGDAIAAYIASSQEIRRRQNNNRLATQNDGSMGDDEAQTIEDFYRKENEGIYMVKDFRDLTIDPSETPPARRSPKKDNTNNNDDEDDDEEETTAPSSATPVPSPATPSAIPFSPPLPRILTGEELAESEAAWEAEQNQQASSPTTSPFNTGKNATGGRRQRAAAKAAEQAAKGKAKNEETSAEPASQDIPLRPPLTTPPPPRQDTQQFSQETPNESGAQEREQPQHSDLSRVEELLQQLVDQGGSKADADKAMADASKPAGFGIGASVMNIPELDVKIKGIDPVAAEQLRLLQTRVATKSSTEAMRLAHRQESTLQSIAQILKSGGRVEDFESELNQMEARMRAGDIDGAEEIAKKINPNQNLIS